MVHIVYLVNWGIWDGMFRSKTPMNSVNVFSSKQKAMEFVSGVKNIAYKITKLEVDDCSDRIIPVDEYELLKYYSGSDDDDDSI